VYNLLWNEPDKPFPTQKNGGPGKVACRSIRWLWVFPWPIPKCNFVVSIMFSIVTDHIKKERCLQMSHLRKKPKKKFRNKQTQPPKTMSYACGEPFKLLKCHTIHPISWMQNVYKVVIMIILGDFVKVTQIVAKMFLLKCKILLL